MINLYKKEAHQTNKYLKNYEMDKGFPTPLNYLIDQQVTIAKKAKNKQSTQHTPCWNKDNNKKVHII